MGLETELKFERVDLDDVAATLHHLGAERQGRWFEQNMVCDTPSRTLRERSMLLRLRRARGCTVLTLKRPPETPVPEGFKHWDEVETVVADFDAMRTVLAALGFAPAFRYEKVREEWRLDGVTVCLDLLPFGQFVELEGAAEAIERVAARLGLDMATASTATYHDLNRIRRHLSGRPESDDFVFGEAERELLLRCLAASKNGAVFPAGV